MITQLIKIGDEYAVPISEQLLKSINATAETQFELTIEGDCIVLTPISHEIKQK